MTQRRKPMKKRKPKRVLRAVVRGEVTTYTFGTHNRLPGRVRDSQGRPSMVDDKGSFGWSPIMVAFERVAARANVGDKVKVTVEVETR